MAATLPLLGDQREQPPFPFHELHEQPGGPHGPASNADAVGASGAYTALPAEGQSGAASLRRFSGMGGRPARARTTTTASVDDSVPEETSQDAAKAAAAASFMNPYGSTSFADSKVRRALFRPGQAPLAGRLVGKERSFERLKNVRPPAIGRPGA